MALHAVGAALLAVGVASLAESLVQMWLLYRMASAILVWHLECQSNSTRNFAIDFVFLRMWVCQRLETILLGKSRETLAV